MRSKGADCKLLCFSFLIDLSSVPPPHTHTHFPSCFRECYSTRRDIVTNGAALLWWFPGWLCVRGCGPCCSGWAVLPYNFTWSSAPDDLYSAASLPVQWVLWCCAQALPCCPPEIGWYLAFSADRRWKKQCAPGLQAPLCNNDDTCMQIMGGDLSVPIWTEQEKPCM